VLGLAGAVVGPLRKGEAVLIAEDGGRFQSAPRESFDMSDGKGREGYRGPFAGVAGAAPARSALTLRLVLAAFGLLVCAAGAVVFWSPRFRWRSRSSRQYSRSWP